MDKFVIGIDGGGTKTDVVIVNQQGSIIGRTKGGSSNYQVLGGAKLKQVILSLLKNVLKGTNVPANKIAHIFMGLAGAGRKSDQQEIVQLFNDSEFNNKITVDSDAIIALVGAFGNQPGIILISGTGSICFGMNTKGKVIRSGGWGYLLGDEGSGYYIGREAILASLKSFDGRGEKTSLCKEIEKKFELKSIDLIIPKIYKNKIDRTTIANLAPLVFNESNNDDEVAKQIIKHAGNELGKLAKAVAQKLNFTDGEIKVALIGSIFKQRKLLLNEITKELYELSWDVEITEPKFAPAIGAAILALEKNGKFIDENILLNLTNSSYVTIQ